MSSLPIEALLSLPTGPITEADGSFSLTSRPSTGSLRTAWTTAAAPSEQLSCNSGWTAWLNDPNRQIIDRATGEKHPLKDYVKLEKWGGGHDPATYKNNPLYREFLVTYVQHLKDLGVNDFSYYELFDEPNDNSRWLAMIEHHKWFREVVPDLNLLNCGVDPLQVKAGENPLGLIDAWAPHLTHISPELDAAIKERRAQHGEKYWGYTCGEGGDGKGNYSPYIRMTARTFPRGCTIGSPGSTRWMACWSSPPQACPRVTLCRTRRTAGPTATG